MGAEPPDRKSSPIFGPLGLTYFTGESLGFVQDQSSEFNPLPLASFELVSDGTDRLPQNPLPALSAAEKWDLQGYFQLAYSLATASLSVPQTELSLWDTYRPSLIEAFYRAFDDTDGSFTNNELAAAFENCAERFAIFNQWPQQTKDNVFSSKATGEEALVAILQLVKLAKGFGIEGESWWELRHELWMGFVEPFQQHGWVSSGGEIFQKLFREGLDVFFNVGIHQGSWTYVVIRELSEWRKEKESQELVAVERAMIASRKRSIIANAWQTLKDKIINARVQSASEESLAMSPGSCLRENERKKPLLNLQMRLAPSPIFPPIPRRTPSSTQPHDPTPAIAGHTASPLSYITLGHFFLENQSCASTIAITPKNPPTAVCVLEGLSDELQIWSEDFVGTYQQDFGEFMDVDPLDCSSENGLPQLSWPKYFLPNGIGAAIQPTDIEGYRMDDNQTIGESLEDTGGQLWQMSDGDFREFCGALSPC